MAHAHYHSVSSARKFGGKVEDYYAIHEWFDQTKAHLADPRHRMVLHNTFGIFLAEDVFGKTIINSEGSRVPVRAIGEQHVREDLGKIPTLEECLRSMTVEPWMHREARRLSVELEKEENAPSY